MEDGIDGAGVTVAYIVTNPDPTLVASMASYDAQMNLPAADITDMALPAPTNPAFTCQIECSNGEDELDAEAIHSMAPFAKIIFVHPSVPETIGMQGWPQVAQAIKMISDEHLADVISVSLGDGESDFINDPTNPTADQAAAIHSLDPAFLDAAVHHIPVMFASGDCGPTDPPVLGDTGQCTPPSASPMVTQPTTRGSPPSVAPSPTPGLDTTAGRTAPDALWTAPNNHSDAESAGVSTIYPQAVMAARHPGAEPASPAAPTPTSRWMPPTAHRRHRPPSRASSRWPRSYAMLDLGFVIRPWPRSDRAARRRASSMSRLATPTPLTA